jgi:hypothetical protein
MITYCVGDTAMKRKDFREKREGKLSLDNDEVLGVVKGDDGVYFAVGVIPFANMSVYEFVAYSRSLCFDKCSNREIKYYSKLFGFSLPLKRKMKSLSVVKYRTAQFLAGFSPQVKEIYMNFDGLEYTHKNAKELVALLKKASRFYEVFVSVSDSRFIPPSATLRRYDAQGVITEIRSSDYSCEKANKKTLLSIMKESYDGEKLKPKKVTRATE